MSPVKQYREYLSWFDKLSQSPQGCEELIEAHCWKSLQAPWPFGFWCMMTADAKKLRTAVSKNIEFNHKSIADACRYVNGNPASGQLLNEEYIQRGKEWHSENQRRREYDIEWLAHDAATQKAQNSTGQAVYAEWEKGQPKGRQPIAKSLPINRPLRPTLFKRIWMWFKHFGHPDFGRL